MTSFSRLRDPAVCQALREESVRALSSSSAASVAHEDSPQPALQAPANVTFLGDRVLEAVMKNLEMSSSCVWVSYPMASVLEEKEARWETRGATRMKVV